MKFPTCYIVLHRRPNSDGRMPVYLRVTYLRKHRYFATGVFCAPEHWIESDARVSKTGPGHQRANELIRLIEHKAKDALYTFSRDGTAFSFDRFEKLVFSASAPVLSRNVAEYALERYNALESEGRAGNAAFFKSLSSVVSGFRKSTAFSEINLDWLNKFERYLRTERGNSDGGVSVTMRTLRALCNYAADKEDAPADWRPFHRYKIRKADYEGGGRALSLADFRKIEAAPTDPGTEEDLSRDLFMLSFYLRGANLADLARLTKKNIVSGRVEFIRHKTRNTKPRLYSMPLVAEVAEIFQKYQRKKTSPWILPILDGVGEKDEKGQKARVDRYTGIVNAGIKKLAESVGVDPGRLHFYSARHTGATALDLAGVDIRIIQNFLGHEDLVTTQVYLKKRSPAEIDEAAEILRNGGK